MDVAFDNGLRKDYGNSEIRYDHFYYKEKKLSFTRQEFCNAHQLGAGKSFRICLAKDCIIGAGSTVIKDIKEEGTYIGSPAERMKKMTNLKIVGVGSHRVDCYVPSYEMGCIS